MIEREICQRVLQKAVSTGADYAEIFAENTVNHSINMISSKVDAILMCAVWKSTIPSPVIWLATL